MKTILVTAYAINPFKGSEDGTGWNLVGQIARYNKVIVVTRENNQPAIEKYLKNSQNEMHNKHVEFLYFDLPYWMRFWKRGERGAMLYFYLWQFFMPGFIKKSKVTYDILHNLNFHNDWTPTFLWRLGKPLVWGPIGHHPKAPAEYVYKSFGLLAYVKSRALWLVKNVFWNCDPFLQMALKRTDKFICMNTGVEKIHALPKQKIVYMSAVGAESIEAKNAYESKEVFTILSVGRLVPLKGFDITLMAFYNFYMNLTLHEQKYVRLHLVGRGPLLKFLQDKISELSLEDAVVITEWVEKDKMNAIYENASVFFFPSHEGAGMVVPEALSFSLPVVCFDNEGPGEFVDSTCSLKVPYTTYDESVDAFCSQLNKLFKDRIVYEQLAGGALNKFNTTFDWKVKGEILKDVYDTLTH